MLFQLSVSLCSYDILLFYDIINVISNLKVKLRQSKAKSRLSCFMEMCVTENALTKVS